MPSFVPEPVIWSFVAATQNKINAKGSNLAPDGQSRRQGYPTSQKQFRPLVVKFGGFRKTTGRRRKRASGVTLLGMLACLLPATADGRADAIS